jgi:hypothetical protein
VSWASIYSLMIYADDSVFVTLKPLGIGGARSFTIDCSAAHSREVYMCHAALLRIHFDVKIFSPSNYPYAYYRSVPESPLKNSCVSSNCRICELLICCLGICIRFSDQLSRRGKPLHVYAEEASSHLAFWCSGSLGDIIPLEARALKRPVFMYVIRFYSIVSGFHTEELIPGGKHPRSHHTNSHRLHLGKLV